MGLRFGRPGGIAYLDIFGTSNNKTTYSGLIQGKQGGGKSVFSKKVIMAYVKMGTRCFVVDPHGEWKHIAELYGFPVYTIGKTSINVLDLDGTPLPAKISLLAEVFDQILGDDPSRAQHVVIRQSLKRTYGKFGLRIDKPKTWNRECPTLLDVYEDIKGQIAFHKGVKRVTHEVILEALEDYAIGVFSKSLVGNTLEINWKAGLVVFDVSKADPSVRKLVMLSIMGRVYSKSRASLDPAILLIDEGWRMLENDHVARYVGEFMKEGRKTNTSLILIIHHLGDLAKVRDDIADDLKRGMGWHAIFHIDESARRHAARELGLTEIQEEFIRASGVGELLLVDGNQSSFCRVVLTGSREEFDINTEYWQFTTRPEDVERRNQKFGKTRIRLRKEPEHIKNEPEEPNYKNFGELKKLILPSSNLMDEEKKRLEKKGYKIVRVHQVSGYGTEVYYVHESIKNKAHDVGVYQLAYIISSNTGLMEIGIKISYNYGCDIEFEHGSRRLLIEYANSKASTSDLAKKIELEKEVGAENYFVVVSKEGLKKRYQGFRNVLMRGEFAGLIRTIKVKSG